MTLYLSNYRIFFIMVSSEFRKSFAQGYLLLANILNNVKIEKLVVPDVVQTGSTSVALDCQFAVVGDGFTLQWWFRSGSADRSALVYEWTPPLLPKVTGVLEGRLNISYKTTVSPTENYRGIRLLRVDPQLSGEYACVVIIDGKQAREAKRMLVFSPEEEFQMTIQPKNNSFRLAEISCLARGVYPQPDIILESNRGPIAQQVQRVWHANGLLTYDAEAKALARAPGPGAALALTCRLHLPQADYTAIIKKMFTFDGQCYSKASIIVPQILFVALLPLLLTVLLT